MTLTPSFITCFLCTILLSLGLYLIGHIINSFLYYKDSKNQHQKFFKKLTLGIIVSVVTYAIAKTSFNTILAGTIPVTILFLFWNKPDFGKFKQELKKTEWKAILYFLSGLLFLFCYFWFRAVSLNGFVREAFIDYPYYAAIGDFLNQYGIESTNITNIYPDEQHPVFYHYFNEWFMALVARIFNITSLSAYTFAALPVIWSVAFSGAVALTYRFFNKNTIIHWLTAMSLFFILGLGEYLQHLFFIDKGISFWDLNFLDPRVNKLSIAVIIGLHIFNDHTPQSFNYKFLYPLAYSGAIRTPIPV